MTPEPGQLVLLVLSACVLLVGHGLSLSRLRTESADRKRASRMLYWLGIGGALLAIVWHHQSSGQWTPLASNFDTLAWLGLLLAALTLYVQWARPLGGLDWFVIPVSALLLILAAVFGSASPHEYVRSAWSIVHRMAIYAGVLGFAIAAASGAMYLITSRRLRRKSAPPAGQSLGSLERLEQITLHSVTGGFALLTVGLITGFAWMAHENSGQAVASHWFLSPKVLLGVAVWVVYGLVLHSPLNPSFRGRRTAALSVAGFVLMLVAMVVVEFYPTGGLIEDAEAAPATQAAGGGD